MAEIECQREKEDSLSKFPTTFDVYWLMEEATDDKNFKNTALLGKMLQITRNYKIT